MNKLVNIFCVTFVLLLAYSYGAADNLLKENLPKHKKPPVGIVNGTDAEDGEFPYMVQLRSTGFFTCGGTIIGDKWILTTAHCIEYDLITEIVYGTNILYDFVNTSTIINVKESYLHPKFDYNQTTAGSIPVYDVGILELEEPLPLNSSNVTIGVVQLPDSDEVPINVPGVLAGWGVNYTEGVFPAETLQKVELQLLSSSECSQKIFNYSGTEMFDETHNLCSDNYYNGECFGDLGSPFLINGIQYGIASWFLKPCGIVPGTYSRITNPEYREFITNVTGI